MARRRRQNIKIYTLLSDGEFDGGQVCETVTFTAHYKLDNLCIAVDVNGLQIDGHDFDALEKAFETFHAAEDKPTVIFFVDIFKVLFRDLKRRSNARSTFTLPPIRRKQI